MSEYTMFICLGGTGTQIGNAVGNLYPLVMKSGVINNAENTYKMFIMDKDTRSKNYEYCVNTCDRYKSFCDTLPFSHLSPYEMEKGVYQELQSASGKLNTDYTVMDLIGKDLIIQELASMCWQEEKYNELIRDGNNRDPSRGSLDAYVCLEYFEESSLFKELDYIAKNKSIEKVRLVILGGATGGMGSSLIVPLIKKIKNYYDKDDSEKEKIFEKFRTDLIILGTYFEIPENPNKRNKVDDIGITLDSYYRVSDQLQELEEDLIKQFPKDTWRVYYTAIPGFDNICGEFNKNGAEKRKTHFLELIAALAAFYLQDCQEDGVYQTILHNPTTDTLKINWNDLPYGDKIRSTAVNFMKLLVIMAYQVYPSFLQEEQALKKDIFVKKYIKHPENNMAKIKEIRALNKEWLTAIIPYFEFWNEIQEFSKLGGLYNTSIDFFPTDDMNEIDKFLKNIFGDLSEIWTETKRPNKMPLCQETWMNYIFDIKPKNNKKNIQENTTAKDIFKLIIQDVYNMLEDRKED